MSDTGEQGMTPHDPAAGAGIGAGIIPDDQGEGYEQAELARRHSSDDENREHEDDESGETER
jgi:hypothetical protein